MSSRTTEPTQTQSRTLALILLCCAQFMVILDTTIVNVALPSMQTDLGFTSQADLQYVISLYALTFGGFLIPAGRLADLFGRRRIFVLGLVVFGVSSLLCGFAPNSGVMLAGRAVQGLGSAMVSPAALSLLTTLFAEGSERNRALGAWGAAGGAAGATGLILGGLLTATAGWEWVFFINIPICVLAVFAAARLLPVGQVPGIARAVDLPGALTITLSLGLLIFSLSQAEHTGLANPLTLGMLAAAALLLVFFVMIERRTTHPVVAFRLFRLPGVAGANVSALLLNTVIASQLFFTTLYVQQVLGFSALQTGLAFLPNSALVLVGSAIASRLVGRTGAGALLATGFVVVGVSALLLTGVDVNGNYVSDVLPGFTLTGLGLGMAFVSVTVGATTGATDEDQGLASGVVNSALQAGFAVGIAAVVAAAFALGSTNSAGQGVQAVAGYSVGYLIDALLAGLAAVLALVFVRGQREQGIQPALEPQ